MRFFNKKGNALLIAIITLVVLGMLGIAHIASSQMSRRRTQVMFKGIDANFLLEGIIAQSENYIRGQANSYSEKPNWFNVFRKTSVGSDSGWIEIDLSGKPIYQLAEQVDAEIKARARFFANDVLRRGNRSDGDSVNFGMEKAGQLEIMAQVGFADDDYYIGHVAKDVKVVNPLTLSHDGQYNGLNEYTMFIKYATQEYRTRPQSDPDSSSADSADSDAPGRHGNIFYNRIADESNNEYYFVRLNNDSGSETGRVYLGSHFDVRHYDNVNNDYIMQVLVDLPRGGYGDYYEPVYDEHVYKIEVSGDTHKFKAKFSGTFGSKKKTVYEGQIALDKDYKLILSMLGEKALMEIYDNLIDQLKEAVGKKIRNQPGNKGQRLQIAAGEFIKAMEPEVYKTVDGWEYATYPYSVDVNPTHPGYAKLSTGEQNRILVKNPEDYDEFEFMGLVPRAYDARQITGDLRAIMEENKEEYGAASEPEEDPEYETSNPYPAFLTAFTYNFWFNDRFPQFNSFSHSSFIEDDLLEAEYNGNDPDHGFRAHPVLQLQGRWVDGSFESPTKIEGNVFGRYMESYYVRLLREEEVALSDAEYQDIVDEVDELENDLDELPDDWVSECGSCTTKEDVENCDECELPALDDDDDYDHDTNAPIEYDSDEFDAALFKYTVGPEIREEVGDYNSRAHLVPINPDGLDPDSSTISAMRIDPDFANVYLDKVTSIYLNYIDFAHNCAKVEDGVMTIYLNGIYLINSVLPLPITEDVNEIKFEGKGALLVAGDIFINKDVTANDLSTDMLILASIGKRGEDGLEHSSIFIEGDGEEPLNVQASLVALNRDFISQRANMGVEKPNFVMFSYGANILGNWAADFMYFYPTGKKDNPNVHKGVNLIYDPRLANDNSGDINLYLADIALPFAFYHVGRQKTSEF
ncbi:MAG: hypothetical protein ACQESP_06150 [Candidatus Muiribacteriota bacterium]